MTEDIKGFGELQAQQGEGCSSLDTLTIALVLYLFLEFEPQLGKSEKFNTQGMKENKAFRIPFIIKKQLKSKQALHTIFLKHKVYRSASILYCNASLSDVPYFSKMSQPRGLNQQMVLNCCLPPPLSFKNSLKANINIYQPSDLNKYQLDLAKKSSRLF